MLGAENFPLTQQQIFRKLQSESYQAMVDLEKDRPVKVRPVEFYLFNRAKDV